VFACANKQAPAGGDPIGHFLGERQRVAGHAPAPVALRYVAALRCPAMQLRSFLPLAPLTLRPVLTALCDWMERTDARLAALERSAKGGQ